MDTTTDLFAAYPRIAKFLGAEFSERDIRKALEFARSEDAYDNEDGLSIAIARLLYTDSHLEDGARYPVEAGSLHEVD